MKRDRASRRRYADAKSTCVAPGCNLPGMTLELPACIRHWKQIGPDLKPVIDRECLPGTMPSRKIRQILVEALTSR